MLKTQSFVDWLKRISISLLGQDLVDILKHSNNYFWGSIAAQGLGLIALPVLTRLLTPAEYGIYQIYRSYTGLALLLLTLNFFGSVARYYFDKPDDFKEFTGTSLFGSMLILGVASLFILLFKTQVAGLLGIPERLVYILLLFTFLKVADSVYDHICKSRKDSLRFSVINSVRTYLGFGLGVVIILILPDDKYIGPVLGTLLASILVGVYVYHLLRKEIAWNPKWSHVLYIFNYSVPLIPYMIGSLLIDSFDRMLINNTFGATDAGLYSLAYNIGMLVGYVSDAFQTALTPDWFKNMREGNYRRAHNIESKSYNSILLIALAGILFSREIITILADERYHAALSILPIIMFGYVFDAMTKVYSRSIGFTNKMIYASITGLVASGVNVALNLILIPQYGYVAAAYTTVVSFLVMFLLAWLIAKFHLKQPVLPLWALWRPTFIFMGGLALSYAVSSLNPPLLVSIFLRMCIWVGFALAAYFTRSRA